MSPAISRSGPDKAIMGHEVLARGSPKVTCLPNTQRRPPIPRMLNSARPEHA